MKIDQTTKNYLISQIGKMRKELGIKEELFMSDYKVENLKKIYSDLADQIDLYPQI